MEIIQNEMLALATKYCPHCGESKANVYLKQTKGNDIIIGTAFANPDGTVAVEYKPEYRGRTDIELAFECLKEEFVKDANWWKEYYKVHKV